MPRSFTSAMLLATALAILPAALQQPEPERIALTVAYVGRPDAERGKSFLEHLGSQFESVEAIDSRSLKTPDQSARAFADADVLIVDADLGTKLPDGYAKPMVVLSGSGVRTAESLGTKLDWL